MARMPLLTATSLLLGFAAAPRYGVAQTAPVTSITLREDQVISFAQAFQAIAAQAHVAIVAEGEPLHATLSKDDAHRLQIKNRPPRVAIEEVAHAFDYDVANDNGVYQLAKRFTDPHDMPEVFLPEWQQSVQDILKILSWYSPHLQSALEGSGKPEPLAAYLMTSLTPEQLVQMKAENGGLLVSSLTPEQRDAVWQAARWFYLQLPEDDLKNAARDLNKIARPQVAFCYHQESGVRYFGVSYPAVQQTGQTPKRHFFALTGSQSGYGINGLLSIKTKPMSYVEQPDASDDPIALVNAPPPSHPSQTLDRLSSTLSTFARGTDHKVTMAVDPIIAAKPVSVFGAIWANPKDVFVAAGRIYGLKIDATNTTPAPDTPDETITLRRTAVNIRPGRVEEVPGMILRIFPLPFQRTICQDRSLPYSRDAAASIARLDDMTKRLKSADLSEPQKKELQAAIRVEQRNLINIRLKRMRMPNVAHTLADAALHRMRIRLDPKLKDGSEVMVAESDPQCQMALSLYSLACTLQSLQWLLKDKPPVYITDFANALIVGGVTTNAVGKQEFGLNLAVPNPSMPHGFESPVGASGMAYIK